MPRGFKRNWFAVESSIIDNLKWMALGWPERGKWLAVRALAERQPSACFKDTAHLATLLRKEGDPTPNKTIETLIKAHLLDRGEDGSICIHDYDDYQPSALRETTSSTERVRSFRDRQKRNETDRNAGNAGNDHRQTDIHTARGAATPGGARARGDGETLKQYLERIGAPIPDVATETMNGKTHGTESIRDDDGQSGSGAKRGRAKTGGRVRRRTVAPADDVPGGKGPEPKGAG